jgi:hypothetical protein
MPSAAPGAPALRQKDERTLLLEHVVSRATSVLYAAPELREMHEVRLAEALGELQAFDRAAPVVPGAPTPAMIAAALDGLKIAHQVVEDCWYSCPKARDADGDSECCNDAISDGACNCGADAHNAKVEALRAALTAQSLPTEQQPAREAQPEPD